MDPVSAGSSPAPESGPHPGTELAGHQDVSTVDVPGGLSPIPHPGLSPNECQELFAVDQIPSGENINLHFTSIAFSVYSACGSPKSFPLSRQLFVTAMEVALGWWVDVVKCECSLFCYRHPF